MHAFVSLPVGERFDPVFETISKVVTLRGLHAIRSASAHDDTALSVLSRAERGIRESRFIIADLTDNHPNVLHEVSYASRLGKPLILISQEASRPTDMHAQEGDVYHYDTSDLDRLHSLLLEAVIDLSSPPDSSVDEAPFYGTLSAKIGMMHTMMSQWKNPFTDD